MSDHARIERILRDDPLRWRLLSLVAELELPDCWIGAGFVRNAVWDALHDRPPQAIEDDVDVIWFDPSQADPLLDKKLEQTLQEREPTMLWSVKNQARMHTRNGDQPYHSASEAMRYWPETATAIAARRDLMGRLHIAAPLGLKDLLSLTIRPTNRFQIDKRDIFEQRVQSKRWMQRWPKLTLTS